MSGSTQIIWGTSQIYLLRFGVFSSFLLFYLTTTAKLCLNNDSSPVGSLIRSLVLFSLEKKFNYFSISMVLWAIRLFLHFVESIFILFVLYVIRKLQKRDCFHRIFAVSCTKTLHCAEALNIKNVNFCVIDRSRRELICV